MSSSRRQVLAGATSASARSHAEVRLTADEVKAQPKPDLSVKRVKSLAVLRESGEYSTQLLEGLVATTFGRFASKLSHSDAFLGLGIRPLTEPSTVGEEYNVLRLRYGKVSATLVGLGDEYALYALASAARNNEEGYNDFTLILVAVLQMLRPEQVVVASASRLVRSVAHQPDLMRALKVNVDRLYTDAGVFDINGPNSQIGLMMLSFVALLAASERDAITTRLGAGKMAKIRRGEWLLGQRAVPLGYNLKDGKLVPDPEQADLLRLALSLLADPSLTERQIRDRLVAAGLPQLRAEIWEANTFPDQRAVPHNVIRRITQWLDLYRTGMYRYPMPVADRWHPLVPLADEVVEQPDGSYTLYTHQQVGRPDIDLAVLDKIAAARSGGNAGRGRRLNDEVGPLVGRVWTDGDYEFKLRGGKKYLYTITRRRTAGDSDGSNAWSQGANLDGLAINTVRRAALHDSMLEAFAAALRQGVPGWHDRTLVASAKEFITRSAKTGQEEASQLLADANALRERATRGRRRAMLVEDDELAASILAESAETLSRARELEEAANELKEIAARGTTPTPETFATDGQLVLAALRVLSKNLVAYDTADLLSQVLDNFRLDNCTGTVGKWSCELLIPGESGDIYRLGPFSGEVPLTGRGVAKAEEAGALTSAEKAQLRDRLVAEGFPVRLAQCAAWSPYGHAAKVALGEPFEYAGTAQGFDADAFLARISEQWTPEAPWDGKQYLRRGGVRQRLANLVAELGGRMSASQYKAISRDLGLSDPAAYIYSLPSEGGKVRPWQPPIRREGCFSSGTPSSAAFFVSVQCPDCEEPATTVLRVLEVPGDLLCATCLRAPADPERLVYPDFYLDLADKVEPVPNEILTKAQVRARMDQADGS